MKSTHCPLCGSTIVSEETRTEQQLVGKALIESQTVFWLEEAIKKVKDPRHCLILIAIQDLQHHGESADIVTVARRLKDIHALDRIGGAIYLTECANA